MKKYIDCCTLLLSPYFAENLVLPTERKCTEYFTPLKIY